MAKQNIKIDTGTILAVGAGIAVIWGLKTLKGLLNSLGLTDSQSTRNLDREAANPYSPWNPLFYSRGPRDTKLLTESECRQMFVNLEDSWGYFDDDEDKAKGVIKGLRTQSQLSFFADWMQKNKNLDLFEYMRGGNLWHRLEDEDMDELNDYIKSLPKYK